MKIHNIEVETPPEGLLLCEALFRFRGQDWGCCFVESDPGQMNDLNKPLAYKRFMPGTLIDLPTYAVHAGKVVGLGECAIRVFFRKADTSGDDAFIKEFPKDVKVW